MVERETGPQSLMERSNECWELGCCSAMCYVVRGVLNRSVPLVGCPSLPFIDQGGAGITDGRKEELEAEKVLRRCQVFLFLWACPANTADGARDSTFADPDRAVLWLCSASGHVTSYSDRRCGVPGCRAVTLQGADGEVTIRQLL